MNLMLANQQQSLIQNLTYNWSVSIKFKEEMLSYYGSSDKLATVQGF